jgi:hypothetical protein
LTGPGVSMTSPPGRLRWANAPMVLGTPESLV